MPPQTRRASRPLAESSVVVAARGPASCAATGAGGERQPGRDAHRAVCANRCSRRRAPRQPVDRPGACAARPRAPSSPSIAVGQRLRPITPRPCGSCAAALVARGTGRLPDGRLTRPLPLPAEGHGREAWCQHWNGIAGGRWGPRLPGQPPSSLVPHALGVRRLPKFKGRSARFGYDTRTYTLRRILLGRRSVPCADTVSDARFRTWCHSGSSRCFRGCELVSLW